MTDPILYVTVLVLIGVFVVMGRATHRESGARKVEVKRWTETIKRLHATKIVFDIPELSDTIVGAQKVNDAGDCTGEFERHSELRRMGVPEILTRPVDLSVRSYYSVLPSIGLLGTFLGVSWALFAIGSAGLESSDDLIPAVRTMLVSMRLAFGSSVFGVLLYLLLQLFHALSTEGLRKAQREALSALMRIPLASAELALVNLDADKFKDSAVASRNAAGALKGAAVSMAGVARTLENAAESLDKNATKLADAAESLSADAIGRAVGERVAASIEDHLKPVFKDIHISLAELASIRADVLVPLVACVTNLQQNVQQMNTTLVAMKTAVNENTESNQVLRASVHELQNLVGKELTVAANALKGAMDGLVESSSAAADAFKESWSGAASQVAATLENHAKLVRKNNEAMSHATEALRTELELVHAHLGGFESVFAQVNGLLLSTRESSAQLSTTARDMRTTIADFEKSANASLARIVDVFADEQGQLVLRLSEALNNLQTAARDRGRPGQ